MPVASSVGLSPASHSSSSSSFGRGERARQLQPLLVDVGECGGGHVGLVAEADALEQARRRALGLAAADSVRGGRRRRRDVLRHVHAGSTRTSWKVRATPSRAIRCGGRPAMSLAVEADAAGSGRSAPEIRLSTWSCPSRSARSGRQISPRVDREARSSTATRPPNDLRQASTWISGAAPRVAHVAAGSSASRRKLRALRARSGRRRRAAADRR